MKKIKIGIIDDEFDARRIIRKYVERYISDFSIAFEAENVEQAVNEINNSQPDVIFLDINLSDGTGFQIIDQLENNIPQIIFTTAYDEYALKAFRYHAIDYILKPIDPLHFKEAIEKIRIKSDEEILHHTEQILSHIKENDDTIKKIAIPSLDGIKLIKHSSIVYFQADASYCKIFLDDNKNLIISKPLKYFADILELESLFIRSHKSFLVNKNFIEEFLQSNGGELKLINGTIIPVSRNKKSETIEILKK